VRQVALLLARFACNNHTICDEELRAIGVGLYPLGALINHSCRPNCMQTFTGRNIVFRWAVPSGHCEGIGLAAGTDYQACVVTYCLQASLRLQQLFVHPNSNTASSSGPTYVCCVPLGCAGLCCAVACCAVLCCAGPWKPSQQASSCPSAT
jgi:hypothetical protein